MHPRRAYTILSCIMETLAAREAYGKDLAGIEIRGEILRFAAYVAGFSTLQLIFRMEWSLRGSAFRHELLQTGALSLMGGFLFGAFMNWYAGRHERKQSDKLIEAILNGDPRIVPSPPSDATHRLPCGLILSSLSVSGGVLYVVPDGLVFQHNYPRRKLLDSVVNRRVAAIPSIDFSPAREVTIDLGYFPYNWFQRLLAKRSLPVLLIQSKEYLLGFKVPAPEQTVSRLQDCLDAARHANDVDCP